MCTAEGGSKNRRCRAQKIGLEGQTRRSALKTLPPARRMLLCRTVWLVAITCSLLTFFKQIVAIFSVIFINGNPYLKSTFQNNLKRVQFLSCFVR